MRVVVFCHSLVSDWNHGNAHFLRGVTAELLDRGHDVRVYEPHDGWSRRNLLQAHGEAPLQAVRDSRQYDLATLDLDEALDRADLVIVHEWSDPRLVANVGERRRRGGFRLLFHDTHHRAVSSPDQMARYDLRDYDGVLAFGGVIRDLYLERGWAQRAWTWHEAADTRVFRPHAGVEPDQDLVWIGNWGDDERTRELGDFLLRPARKLRLDGCIHGVRYPLRARAGIRLAGLRYCGWLPNHVAPEAFARHRVTVHVPRRPYVQRLPGIPTIRVFEALACGIPLVCSPWDDAEHLFRPGQDYLLAREGREMVGQLRAILSEPDLAQSLARSGLETIRARHTCSHRVDELMAIAAELGVRERAVA
jgi:spore maturation protein CgeB